jgi:hypothetical protein
VRDLDESDSKQVRRGKGEREEKKREEDLTVDVASTSAGPCPVIPEHIQKIMDTVDRLDKSEIDDFEAVGQIGSILRERRQKRLEVLGKVESQPSEERSSESGETP